MGQPQKDEEPVAYLGGKAAEPDRGVDGYLGGDAPPDSLPALPPANMTGQYSASDFMAAPPEAEDAPPPAREDFGDTPVAAPAEDPAYFQQYASEEPAGDTTGTDTVAEAAPADATSEFDEPGLPKTISQQDAENIIKRITTKKILPPESGDGPRLSPPSELTPRRGMRAGPIIFITGLVIVAAAGTVMFKEQLAPYMPDFLRDMLIPREETPVVTPTPEGPSPDQLKAKALKDMVLESERRAFGFDTQADFEKSQGKTGTPNGGGGSGGAPAPGSGGH